MNTKASADLSRAVVRSKYARAARRAAGSPPPDECGGSCTAATTGLYTLEQRQMVPQKALEASLGCGNPTALASLVLGEVVLDLGSGGGVDVLLAARSVGPTGFVYGLDMTDEMLALAQANRARQGARNLRSSRVTPRRFHSSIKPSMSSSLTVSSTSRRTRPRCCERRSAS